MKNSPPFSSTVPAIIMGLMLGLLPVHAEDLTWNNPGAPNTWSTSAANWTGTNGTTVWLDGSNAIINGTTQTINVTSTVSLGNLTRTGTGNINVSLGTIDLSSASVLSVTGGSGDILLLNSQLTGSNGFTKNGTGYLRVTANNTGLSGPVALQQGRLSVANSNALGSGTVTVSGGTLDLRSGIVLPNNITMNGGEIINTDGNNQITGIITLGANITMTLNTANNLRLSGGVDPASANRTLSLASSSAGNNGSYTIDTQPIDLGAGGRLNINASSGAAASAAFTANLNVGGNTLGIVQIYNRATLKLGAENALPASTALTLGTSAFQNNTAGMATVDLNGYDLSIGSLASAFNSEVNEGAASNRVITNSAAGDVKTLTVNQTSNTTFRGELRGNLALTKEGAGSLTLNQGNNTFTGNTTVSAGTLLLNGTATLHNSPVITVASGATLNVSSVSSTFTIGSAQTLKGTGSVVGEVLVNGVLAPGNSIGTINTEDLSLGSNGTLDIELGRDNGTPVSDLVQVTGTVDLASGANLQLTLFTGLGQPVVNDVFFLVSNDSSDAVNGVFTRLNGVNTTLDTGSNFAWNSLTWEITYEADYAGSAFSGGNDIAIRVIPEPATWLFVGIGLAAVLFRRPSRRGHF